MARMSCSRRRGGGVLAVVAASAMALSSSHSASADPQVVASAPSAAIAPPLYDTGNLRVAVRCAERLLLPGEGGLRVTIDGLDEPLQPAHVNGLSGLALTRHGRAVLLSLPGDVGYLVAPGRHRLRIEADDCAPDVRDVDVSGSHATHVDGRLPVADDWLAGPVGAPDGLSYVFGGFSSGLPASLASGTTASPYGGDSTYSIDTKSLGGVWLSFAYERRFLDVAFDTAIGGGAVSGTVVGIAPSATGSSPAAAGPFRFTGSVMDDALALRVGARVPLEYVSLAAGAGLGGSMWLMLGEKVDSGSATSNVRPPSGVQLAWDVPLWASATVKPFCDWGVQAMGAYQWQPTAAAASTVMVGVGLEWQPSAACREAPGITVSPPPVAGM